MYWGTQLKGYRTSHTLRASNMLVTGIRSKNETIYGKHLNNDPNMALSAGLIEAEERYLLAGLPVEDGTAGTNNEGSHIFPGTVSKSNHHPKARDLPASNHTDGTADSHKVPALRRINVFSPIVSHGHKF